MILLFLLGILFLIFSKGDKFLTFFALLSIGGGFIFLAKYCTFFYQENLIKLDKNIKKVLKDIDIKGENSEYYGNIDDVSSNQILTEYIKKNKYRHRIFYVFGGVLIFCSLILLI